MPTMLVVCASPRQRANSELLADRVIAGAQGAGVQVEKLRLADYRIGYCRACDACQRQPEPVCVQPDDMRQLLPKVAAADILVFASPIYFFAASGQLKVFLDRLYALGTGYDWSVLKGKRAATVFTYADEDPLASGVGNACRSFQDAFRFLGIEDRGCLHACCTAPGDLRENAALLERAEALGKALAE